MQVLPWGLALARGEQHLELNVHRAVGVMVVLGVFIVGGGVVAILVGDAVRPKQAIAYGVGWQGLFGGFLRSTKPRTGGGAPPG